MPLLLWLWWLFYMHYICLWLWFSYSYFIYIIYSIHLYILYILYIFFSFLMSNVNKNGTFEQTRTKQIDEANLWKQSKAKPSKTYTATVYGKMMWKQKFLVWTRSSASKSYGNRRNELEEKSDMETILCAKKKRCSSRYIYKIIIEE